MNYLSLFSGACGGDLGMQHLLGWKCKGYVEIDEYCQRVIAQRIKDGLLSKAPIFGDIQAFSREGYAESYSGMVDVVTGGFPCQDISSGGNCAGIEGERSGLWKAMAGVIRTVQPRYAFMENSPMLTIRGLGTVLGDLAEMGFDAQWGVLGADTSGMDIKRDRIWIVASAIKESWSVFHRWPNKEPRDMGVYQTIRSQIDRFLKELEMQGAKRENQGKDNMPPYLCELGHALAPELDELKATGNGQIPAVAVLAWETLTAQLKLWT